MVRCRGSHCPISVASVTAPRSGTVGVRRMLGRASLRAGQVVTIRVCARGFVTRVARLTIRRGRPPKGGALAREAVTSVRPHQMGY